MARLWQSGFELNSTTTGVEFQNVTSMTISSSTVRSGTYSGRANPTAGTQFIRSVVYGSNQNTAGYARVYIYIASLPTVNTEILRFANGAFGQQCQIRLTTTGTLQLLSNTPAQVGSDSSALSLNTWYMVELKNDATTSPGTIEGRLDGASFASGNNTVQGSWANVVIGCISTATTADIYFDDWAINDGTGSYQTSYPGSGKIVHLKPNANGTTNSWTIGAGSGSNYEQVDEVTPDDATTYLRSRTTNEVDEYAIEAFPGNSYDTINCIGVGFRATRSAGTTSSGMKVRIRSGSSIETATTEELATNSSFRTNDLDTSNASPFSLVSYVSPATSTAWTPTDVDSAEIGVITSTGSGDRYVHLGTIWASVDYATGTPPAPSTTKTLGLLGVG